MDDGGSFTSTAWRAARGPVLGLLACVLAFAAQGLAPAAALATTTHAPRCATVLIVGARGSGEPAGYGTAVAAAVEGVRARLGSLGVSAEGIPLQYPAVGVGWAAITFATYRAYDSSVAQGVAETKLEVGTYLRRCAGQVVLLGYSQGADVVTRALDAMWRDRRYASLHSRLAAVALFGSPQFRPKVKADAHNGYDHGLSGVGYSIPFFRRFPRLPDSRATTGGSYCLPGDAVCNFSFQNLAYSCAYFTGAACPHYHYADATSEAAGRRVVSLVLGRQCGRIAFAPQSDNLASGIRASGVDCALARAVAALSRRYPLQPPGAVDRYGADGFACTGYSRQPLQGMGAVYYHCTRPGALLTFRRSGTGRFAKPIAPPVVGPGRVSRGAPPVLCRYLAAAVFCPPGKAYLGIAPRTLIFGADGRTELTNIRWSHWGRSVATATATYASNSGPAGKPHFARYPARVTASDLATCDGHRTYLKLTAKAARPSQAGRVGIYPTFLRGIWHHCI